MSHLWNRLHADTVWWSVTGILFSHDSNQQAPEVMWSTTAVWHLKYLSTDEVEFLRDTGPLVKINNRQIKMTIAARRLHIRPQMFLIYVHWENFHKIEKKEVLSISKGTSSGHVMKVLRQTQKGFEVKIYNLIWYEVQFLFLKKVKFGKYQKAPLHFKHRHHHK